MGNRRTVIFQETLPVNEVGGFRAFPMRQEIRYA